MPRSCEVCTGHRSVGLTEAPRVVMGKHRIKRVLIESRIFALCEHHVSELLASGASTVAAVQALFREAEGSRSLVSRRAPLNRRVFPPRPEGRRATVGRRAGESRP